MAIQRVVYTDSSNSEQVLTVFGVSPGNIPDSNDALATASKGFITWRNNGFDKAKIWSNVSLFGDLPIERGNFSSSEPEILFQEYRNGSWVNVFRGFAESQGAIDQKGRHQFTLYDHSKYVGRQPVNVSGVNGTIIDALEAILPSGYSVEAPAEANIDGSYPSVSNWSLTDQAQVGFAEFKDKHNWVTIFTADKDGSGNWIVRFEPKGFGGTVDTLSGKSSDVSGSLAKFKEWKKQDTSNIVNSVEVIGNDSSGSEVTESFSDSTSISNYGEKFQRVQVDYILDTQEDVDDVGNNSLDPTPSEGGRVKAPNNYPDVRVNDSFEIYDQDRNIDGGVFTAVKQKNFYPEESTQLDFQFETNSEDEARKADNLRSERSRITDTSNTDVGGQGLSGADTGQDSAPVNDSGHSNHGVTGNNAQDNASVSDSGHSNHGVSGNNAQDNASVSDSGHSNHGVGGSSANAGGASIIDAADTGATFGQTIPQNTWEELQNTGTSGTIITANTQGIFSHTSVQVNYDSASESRIWMRLADAAGNYYPSSNGVRLEDVPDNSFWSQTLMSPRNTGATSPYGVEIKIVDDSATVTSTMSWYTIDEHFHASGSLDDGNGSANVSDSGHEHASGSLDDGNGSANVSDSGHEHASGSLDDGNGSANVSDPGHGDSSSGGGHGVSGQTDSKNVDVEITDKTDR